MEESEKSRMSQSMPKLKLIRFCFHIDFNIFILLIHTQSLQPTLPNVASKSHRQSKAIADLALDFSDSDKKKKQCRVHSVWMPRERSPWFFSVDIRSSIMFHCNSQNVIKS